MTPEIDEQVARAPEPASGPKALVKKLAAIMAEIDHVDKRGKNEHFDYAYMKASDLAHAVRGKMAERHLIMLSSVESISYREVPARVGVLPICELMVRYTIHDGESGESLTFTMPGSGGDKGDKGVFKSYVGSLKYALRGLFLVPDESEPEADSSTDKAVEREFNLKEDGKAVTKKVTVQPATRTEGPKIIKEETSPAEPTQEGDIVAGEVEAVEEAKKRNGSIYRRVKMKEGNWYSCFDNRELAIADGGKIYMKKLFALLDNATGVKCAFKTTESKGGKFKNIVSVKSIGFYEWDDTDGSPVIQQDAAVHVEIEGDAPVREEWDRGY